MSPDGVGTRSRTHRRRAAAMAVVLPALVAAAVVATRYDGVTWLRGDCPYYYVTSVSLLEDHDLDLWNQLGGVVSIHDRQVAIDRHDRLVPKHPPWMPLAAAPWIAIGGEVGALVFNLSQYVVLLWLLWCLARRAAPPRAASMAAAATGCLTFLPHYVWNFSPDVFTTVLVLAAVCVLTRDRGPGSTAWEFVAGLLLGVAVVSRPTFALVAVPAVVLLPPSRGRDRLMLLLGLTAPLVVAGALNTHLFGSPTTTAYDRIVHVVDGQVEIESHRGDFDVRRLPSGAWGQLVDRRRGLLWTSPITLVALLGLPWLWRRDRLMAAFVVTSGAALYMAFSCYSLWPTSHAGNRFLMPAVALAVVPLAALFAGPRSSHAGARRRTVEGAGEPGADNAAGATVVLAVTTVRRVVTAARTAGDSDRRAHVCVAATASDATQYRDAGLDVTIVGERRVEPAPLEAVLATAERVVVPLGFPRQRLLEVARTVTECGDLPLRVAVGSRELGAPAAGWLLWWWAAASVPMRWVLGAVRAMDGVGVLALLVGGRGAEEPADGPVCHVISGLGTGGAQRQLLEYLRHAAPPRSELRVLALFDDDARFADRLRATGVEVEVVYHELRRSRWHHLTARALPHTIIALALRRRLVGMRPRCVVSWLFVANVVTAAAVGRRPATRLVAWIRNLSAWKEWPEYRHWWFRAADRRAARRASLMLANSDTVARDYERWVGLADGSVHVVVNGVDVSRVREASSPPSDHPVFSSTAPTMITVGRLAREKNVGMLVECCRRLEAVGRPANLVVVGHGELEAELCAAVRTAGLDHRVVIVGGVDRPEAWLSRADMFVLASRIEGMPNALLEAQALGIAAVTTAAGGAVEVVEDGVTGVVVPVDDIDVMVASVTRLLDDPETRREMGRRAAERVADRFGIERFAARLDELTRRAAETSG